MFLFLKLKKKKMKWKILDEQFTDLFILKLDLRFVDMQFAWCDRYFFSSQYPSVIVLVIGSQEI